MTSHPKELISSTKSEMEELDYIQNLIKKLSDIWGKDIFEFDASIMRGFDYYTGLIFEVIDCSPENNRALFGGGRYDNLVGAFGCEPLSGIGYGVSEISIYNFLETHKILPSDQKPVDLVASCLFDTSGANQIDIALKNLRADNLRCERLLGSNKPAKVLKVANRQNATLALMIGPDEAEKGLLKLKNLKTSEEKILDVKDQEQLLVTAKAWLEQI